MLPAGVLACLQALSNYNQLSTLAEESMLQAAVLSTREEENIIIVARRVLHTLAVLPEITSLDAERCDATLTAVRATSEFYGSLAVVDDRGEIVCGSFAPPGPVNVSDRPWFRSVMSRTAFTVTGAAEDLATGAPVLAASLPLTDPDDGIVGALFLSIKTEWLNALLGETGTPDVTHVAIVDADGNVIADDPARPGTPSWLRDPGFLRANLVGGPKAMRMMDDGVDLGFVAVAPLLPDDLYVVVGGAPSLTAAGSAWRLAASIGIPLIMWVIAVAVAWFAMDRLVVRPILRLERTAAAFAAGKMAVRASGLDDIPTEIGQLGRTMNMMADALAVREKDLQSAVAEQKSLLKELHHRVKNNLQVITSLLNLQLHRATGKAERRALRATQDRIYALAKVHDALRQVSGENLIRLDELVPQIAEHLTRADGALGKPVRVDYDLDPLTASSRSGVPIALLLTEAISTALNAARPDGVAESLRVAIKRVDGETMALTVESDRSAAKPHPDDGDDLSAKLVAGFVKQLGGQSIVETKTGYRLRVTIPRQD